MTFQFPKFAVPLQSLSVQLDKDIQGNVFILLMFNQRCTLQWRQRTGENSVSMYGFSMAPRYGKGGMKDTPHAL